jgi:hypothetical protein
MPTCDLYERPCRMCGLPTSFCDQLCDNCHAKLQEKKVEDAVHDCEKETQG